VNVTVENLAPCKKLVRFDIDAAVVDEAFKTVTRDVQKKVALPGFRPGKAPEDRVAKAFEKEIADQAKHKLMSDAYKDGLKEKNLKVLGDPDVEEIQFGKGQAFQFATTIETYPEYTMPEYRGLPVKREMRVVSEEDMTRALDALRGQKAQFQKVDRPLQADDFVVVNYSGTCEGKPITELAPVARGLTEQKNFWIEAKPGAFLPGFSEQLLGAKAGEKRTVKIDFPADFVTQQVAGKQGVYEVEVVEVKERTLPELNDAFAQSYEAETVEKLREGVRRDLQNELNYKQKQDLRNQVVNALLSRVNFDLPETLVEGETRNVVYEIVSDYQQRGLSKEVIEQQKDQIYALAKRGAQGRIKAMFLFQTIAEREGIRVSKEEINAQILSLAQGYKMPVQKFVKQLEERGGASMIYRDLLHDKVIAFLQDNARIEDVQPAPAPAPA